MSVSPSSTISPARSIASFMVGLILLLAASCGFGAAALWADRLAWEVARRHEKSVKTDMEISDAPEGLTPSLLARLQEDREVAIRAGRAAPLNMSPVFALGLVEARLCYSHQVGGSCVEAISHLRRALGDRTLGIEAAEKLTAMYEHFADCPERHDDIAADVQAWDDLVTHWRLIAPPESRYLAEMSRARVAISRGDRRAELQALRAADSAARGHLAGEMQRNALKRIAELAGANTCRMDTETPAHGLGTRNKLVERVWRGCGWLALGDGKMAFDEFAVARDALLGREEGKRGVPARRGTCGLPAEAQRRIQTIINQIALARKGKAEQPICSPTLDVLSSGASHGS